MQRLIDANALYREVKTECNPYGKPTIGFDDGKKVLELIDAAPTIEPEVRHGQWTDNGEDKFICSACKKYIYRWFGKSDYCPNCGADMREVSEDAGTD